MVFRTHTIDVIILCMRINIFKHRNKSLDACIYAYKWYMARSAYIPLYIIKKNSWIFDEKYQYFR